MKILHIAMAMPEFDRSAREMGHDVMRIQWTDYLGRKHPDEAKRRVLNRDIAKALASFGPDLVFLQQHTTSAVYPATLAAMKACGAFVVNWTGDVRDPLPAIYPDLAPWVNVTAFTNWPDIEAMRAMGHDARFLQIGYDETIYKPDGPVAEDAPEIVFMGNNYGTVFPLSGHRAELVHELRAAFGDRFRVYGRGWPYKGVRPTRDAQEEAAIYRGCAVAIHADHFDRKGFYSDRWFKAQACGACTLNLTAVDPHSAADYVMEELSNESARTHADLCAASTRANDTWHDRINTLEQWVKNQ